MLFTELVHAIHPHLMKDADVPDFMRNLIQMMCDIPEEDWSTKKDPSSSNKKRSFYSFATKYCSHHNPLDYPIYDSYVDEMLRYFRNRDNFSDFQNDELKDYVRFKDILIDFRGFYDLDTYNLKQIDQYVWQLGKDYFPKNYGKKKTK